MSTSIPMEAIGKILAEVMKTASANGANSISMPDDYVAVAHFLAYPHEYGVSPAPVGDELRPCPFCGGKVELEQTTGEYERMWGRRQWWGVKCRNRMNLGGSCAMQIIPSASKEAAIKRWNMRAPLLDAK